MPKYRAKQSRFNELYVIQQFNGESYAPVYRGFSVLCASNKDEAAEIIAKLGGTQ